MKFNLYWCEMTNNDEELNRLLNVLPNSRIINKDEPFTVVLACRDFEAEDKEEAMYIIKAVHKMEDNFYCEGENDIVIVPEDLEEMELEVI